MAQSGTDCIVTSFADESTCRRAVVVCSEKDGNRNAK